MKNQKIESINKLIIELTEDHNSIIEHSGSTANILLTNIKNSINKLVEAKQLIEKF